MSPSASRPAPLSAHRYLRQTRAGMLVLGLVLAMAGCDDAGIAVSQLPENAPSLAQNPVQTRQPTMEPFAAGAWRFVPRAGYVLTARVLGREHYRFDAHADVIPFDLALAWGPAAADEVQDELEISQGWRWFYWRSRHEKLPLTRSELERFMANVHIAPADGQVAAFVAALKPGDVVTLSGELVDVRGSTPELARNTSMTRTDTGAGSCEIFYVQAARRLVKHGQPVTLPDQ